MQTEAIIHKYICAFNATEYKVQLSHANRELFKPMLVFYSPEKLIKSIPFLKHKNALGYNIYCRPVGYQYVLLDDLERNVLQDLALIKPCLLMETSPSNYQAFVILQEIPQTREIAKMACHELCEMFHADPGSAEPDHLGRLPGFTNQKPKHRNSKGLFPFVKLHKAEFRLSNFIPHRGGCAKEKISYSLASSKKIESDRSRSDFNTACMLIRQGKSDDHIRSVLEKQSEKAVGRKDDYIGRTINNARKVVIY